MGCACFSCAAAPFTALDLKAEDNGLVQQLQRRPGLLCDAVPTSFLGMHDSALHLASEKRNAQGVQQIFQFLVGADMTTLQEALRPFCRRLKHPLPTTPGDAVRMAANLVNTKGQTPLMYACYANAPEIVRELLTQGADPWVTDRCGCRNALHYAAMAGSAECVEALLRHSPPGLLTRQGIRYINARSLSGLTPLHYAVFFEHEGTVEELLQHDPNINAATTAESYDVWLTYDTYSTPLHFAAFKNHMPSARLLLLHYARRRHTGSILDPRLRRNSAGLLPWQVARGGALASMLHPGMQLAAALAAAGATDSELLALQEQIGPPQLAAIAAATVRQKLLSDLEVVERNVVEEEGAQQRQASRTTSLLCGTPHRGARASWRDLSRSISRSLSRTAARVGSGARLRRVPTASTLPRSPRRAPTLDRVDRLDGASPNASEYPGGGESLYSVGTQTPPPPPGVAAGALPGRVVRDGGGNRRVWEDRASGAGGLPRNRSGRMRSGRLQGGGHFPTAGGMSNYSSVGTPHVGASGYPLGGGGLAAGASPPVSLYPTYSTGTIGLQPAYSGGGAYPPGGGSPTPTGGLIGYAAIGALNSGGGGGVANGGSPGGGPAGGSPTSRLPLFPALGSSGATGGSPAGEPAGLSPTASTGLHFPALGVSAGAGAAVAQALAAAATDPTGGSPGDSGSRLAGGSPQASTATGMLQQQQQWVTPHGGSPRGSSPIRSSGFAVGTALGLPSGVSAFAVGAAGGGGGGGAGEAAPGYQPTCVLSPAASLHAGSVAFTGTEGADEDEYEGTCNVCFARRETVAPAVCGHGLCTSCAGELCRAMVNRPLLCPFCRQVVTKFVRINVGVPH